MPKINVLHLINEIEPAGAETLLLNTVRHFDKEKFSLTIAYFLGPGTLAPEMRDAGAEVVDFSREGKVDLLFLAKLINFVWENDIDIIHTHLIQASLIGRLVARLMGVRLILSTRHFGYDHKENRLVRRLQRFTAPIDSMTLAVSKPVKDYMVFKEGSSPERVEIVPNAIDIALFKMRDPENILQGDLEAPVIGAVGRLHPSKGYDIFLEAARIVLSEKSASRFKIVGEGELLKPLQRRAEQLGISEAVEFMGQRPPAEIPDILAGFDIFVQASNWEAFGIAIVEAMACGLPVVATRVEGVVDIIEEGVDGCLVPPKDPEALAARILQLLRDPRLRAEIGVRARRKVEANFDIRHMTARMARIYQELLNGGR